MTIFKRRPSPAIVVACIAMVLALAGTTYAGLAIPPNSVGQKQLKANAVTSAKIRNGAVRPTDISSGVIPLRSGEIVTGAIGADLENPAPNGDFADTANLPAEPPVALDDTTVDVDGGDEVGGRCTGTADAPTAPGGVVCIYNEGSANATTLEGFSSSDGGFVVHWIAPAAGDTFFSGVWAYRAP